MGRRYRNPNPHLDIQYVTTWSARIPRTMNGRGQPLKSEPLDPEDEFIADTDPDDKPLKEATLDDIMEGYEDPEPDADPTDDLIAISDILDIMEDRVDRQENYNKAYSDDLRGLRGSYKEAGLPWIFSRNTMMEIGMRCDVDYEIEPHYKRVMFEDPALNDIIIATADLLLQKYDSGEVEKLTPKDAIDLVVLSYTGGQCLDIEYDVEKFALMMDLGIEEQYSAKGNPIGEFALFERAFNKVYKDYYKNYYGFGFYSAGFADVVELELDIQKEKRRQKNVKSKTLRQLDRYFAFLDRDFPKETWNSPEERMRVKDAWFAERHGGCSLYEWNDLRSIEPFT